MQQLLGVSCGLDIHKDMIAACILKARHCDTPEVIQEEFTTMRGDLFRLRDWVQSHGCMNVAMESTGVYWKPVYGILEEVDGMNLCLTNAYHMRNVPGRKNDEDDAEWIAALFMCGLLNKSFVPERGIRDLREYTRYHVKLTQSRVRLLNRIEKLLQTHGFKLSSVLSSIDGVSGQSILEKLGEQGEVSVSDVRSSLERGVKKTAEEIAYAINGKLPASSQMLLRTMLDGLNSYDRQLADVFSDMMNIAQPYLPTVMLLATIPGINILSATCIIAEIGVDMSQFAKGAASLTKWAGLVPRDDKSAGKVISNKILKGNSYVKAMLCQCAWAATKTRKTRPANWYWSNVKRLGEKTAIIAVARKLLVYVYNIITTQKPYDTQLDVADAERIKAKKLESAKRQISMLESKVPEYGTVDGKDTHDANKVEKTTKHNSGSKSEGQKSPVSSLDDLYRSVASNSITVGIDGQAPEPISTDMDDATQKKKRGRPKKILQPG